jgi:hypothetical protein
MPRGYDSSNRGFSDRDEEGEDLGYGGGGSTYDDEDEEDGGWAITKDQSDDLWDSAEDADTDDEEEGRW